MSAVRLQYAPMPLASFEETAATSRSPPRTPYRLTPEQRASWTPEAVAKLDAQAAAYDARFKVESGAPDADPEVARGMRERRHRRAADRKGREVTIAHAQAKFEESKARYDAQQRRFRRWDARERRATRCAPTLRRRHHARARRPTHVRAVRTVRAGPSDDGPGPEPPGRWTAEIGGAT